MIDDSSFRRDPSLFNNRFHYLQASSAARLDSLEFRLVESKSHADGVTSNANVEVAQHCEFSENEEQCASEPGRFYTNFEETWSRSSSPMLKMIS